MFIRSVLVVLTLCSFYGCASSTLGVRAPINPPSLRLEIVTNVAEVRAGEHVTLHVRLSNISAAPVRNVAIALGHAPSLVPVGGTGSTMVHADAGAFHIEPIVRLDAHGLAEWWIVLRALAPGDASARAMAVPAGAEGASFETVQWRVIDVAGASEPIDNDDPVALARWYIALSQENRARGRHRDELHALYAARIFIEQAAPSLVPESTWPDLADRAWELYQLEYGVGPAPLEQAALQRSSVLTGVLVDNVSLSPVADATITLHSMLTDAIYASVTSGADGTFEFTDLDAEPVVLVAARAGYQTALRAGFELLPHATTRLITELAPETVAAQRRANEGWDLAELYGTLSGYRGDGAAEVEVILVGADTRAAVTDEHGQFRFADVTPGDYTFVAQKPGFAAIELRTLNVTPGDVVEVQFTLEPE